MNRKVILPIIVLIVGAVGTYVLIQGKKDVQSKPTEKPPPLVRVQSVHPTDFQIVVRSQGTVTPRTQTILIAQVAGQITGVSPAFVNGGFFEKGDVLLTIDSRDYEIAVAQAQVGVAQAKLRLVREEEEAALALAEWERLGRGDPSDLVLRKPQIAEARASIDAAEGVLRRTNLDLDRTQIRAPYPGRVRAKDADVGQYVNRGSLLGRIYAIDYAEVRLPVPDDQLAYLDLPLSFRHSQSDSSGPEVRFHTTYAGRELTYMGRIVRVEGEIDARSGMTTLVGRVDDPYRQREHNTPPLTVGMFVTAEVFGHHAENVVVIPPAALRAENRVLVVADNRLYYRTVDILFANAENVVVRSGLKSGEQVCVSSLDVVVDGMYVRTMDRGDDQ